MKVLFIGGTGIISTAVTELCSTREDIELFLLNRGNKENFIPNNVSLIKGDINNKNFVNQMVKDYSFDVVVNWIAFTPNDIKRDLELFQGKIGQYIFISSASAYQKPPKHYIIDESTPLTNPYWQYSRDKIACEELLNTAYRDNDFPITIVRPSLTYGNTMIPYTMNSWEHPWTLIDRMRKGKEIVMHGDGTSLWTITHNTDFAKGFIGLIGNKHSLGHAFHITSDEVLSWNQIIEAICDAVDLKPNIINIPTQFITTYDPEQIGTLIGDKAVSVVFDNSKIKRFVPYYKATIPFSKGIKKTVDWFLSHPEICTIDHQYNEWIDKLIDRYIK